MKGSPLTESGNSDESAGEANSSVSEENITSNQLNVTEMAAAAGRDTAEDKAPVEEKINNLSGCSSVTLVDERDVNSLGDVLQKVSISDSDEYATRGPTGGVATDPTHQYQHKANKNIPLGPFIQNYTAAQMYQPVNCMPQFPGKRSVRDDEELQPHKYMNPGTLPPTYGMRQDRPPAYPCNNLNIGGGGVPGMNGLMYPPGSNFIPEPIVTQHQVLESNHGSGCKVTVRSPEVVIPDPFKTGVNEQFNVDNFLAELTPQNLDQYVQPLNHQMNQQQFSVNNMMPTSLANFSMPPTTQLSSNIITANTSSQFVEDFSGPSYRNRRSSDPSDSGVESAEERSPYTDPAPSPTGSTYTSPPSVDSGCGRSPIHDPYASGIQVNQGGSPPKYQDMAMSPAAYRATQSPAATSGYGSDMDPDVSGSQYIDSHKDDLQMALSVIYDDLKQDGWKKKKAVANPELKNTNIRSQPVATVTTQQIPQPAQTIVNQTFVQQAPPTSIMPPMPPPSAQHRNIIILPPSTQPPSSNAIVLVPVPQGAILSAVTPPKRGNKPKTPRPILPKVSGTVNPGTQSTTTTPSQKQGVAMATKVIPPTGSYINRNIPNQNQVSAQQQQQQQNKQIQIARRTVADIPPDKLQQSDEEGDTYLHIAVCKTDQYMVLALLERLKRQDQIVLIDRENKSRQTPLYLAVVINHPAMVQMFIRFQANVNTLAQNTRDGQAMEVKAAIHIAASNGKTFLTTLQELLKAPDISINNVNNLGQTALHCAVLNHGKARGHGTIDSIPIVRALLKAGADAGAQDKRSGKTPLMYAIEKRDLNLVNEILRSVDQSKARNLVKTQAFDGSSCLRIAEGLKGEYDQQAWNQLYNSLQNAISGNVVLRA